MRYTDRTPELVVMPSRAGILFLVYTPWVLAECLTLYPTVSYLISWLGSFMIFYLTLLSPVRFLSRDRPLQFQVLRPIVLIQLIFAGFMCCTSIFYFIDHFTQTPFFNFWAMNLQADELTILVAKAQRISLLAHAALVTGIILRTNFLPRVKFRLTIKNESTPFIICILTYSTSIAVTFIPGVIQLKYMLMSISFSTSVYILVKGLVQKKVAFLIFGGSVFVCTILNSTLTGYKENIIINVILLVILAFPYYRRTVIFLFIPCACLLVYILPTFTNIIRIKSWIGGQPNEVARKEAFQTFLNDENEQLISENNWSFLTNRASEIDMFTKYLKTVPGQIPYYSFGILINSIDALIPRLFWKNKPDTEKVAMERVYRSGVAHPNSPVSAKTRPVIDGYLSAGIPGVFVYMLAYGMLIQTICNIAERLFGGYDLGCVIIFNGIFQPTWRGNTMEFLFNNILYGYLLMLAIHFVLIQIRFLVTKYENHSYNTLL